MNRIAPESEGMARGTPIEGWVQAADAVTDVLAATRGLAEAASGLLRALGDCLGCEGGTLWLRDRATERLTSHLVWESAALPRSRDGGAAPQSLERGAGLAGTAWALLRPVWTQDLAASAAEATPGGDEAPGGVAIPIVYGADCLGVVELAARRRLPARGADRVAASTLGRQVGQFVAREEALRAHVRLRRELTDLFENAPVGVLVLDAEGRIARANRAGLQMLGFSRDECVGRLWRDVHEDPAEADRLLARLKGERAAEVKDVDVRLKRRDGSVRQVRLDANVLHEEDGSVVVRAFTRDVTEAREAESALEASEERHRLLVEAARDYAILPLDAEGRVAGWNSGACRLYGWEAREVLGRDFTLSFIEEDRAAGLPPRALRLAAEQGEFRHEGWRVKKDGSRFWAETVVTALHSPAGRLEGYSHLTRDATERRRLDDLRRSSEELVAANRAVIEAGRRNAALLRSVAEAIEGPMGRIEAASSLLPAADDPAGEDAVGALLASVADLRRAVTDLGALAASRESLGPPEGAVPVDLLRLATETRDLLREAAAERRVRVDLDVDPDLVGVVADPDRVRQVIFNYLSNGIRFNREGGRVAVRIVAEGLEQYRVEVEDSGLGIAPEDIGRIFAGPADPSDATAGVGLPATQRIVEQQGGRVGVQSTPGRGTVFFAVLPRVPRSHETPAEGEVEVTRTGSPRHALVVSADPATRASLAWTLGSLGFETESAAEGDEALERCRERPWHTIAVDLRLPGVGAIDVAAVARTGRTARGAPLVLAAFGSSSGAACLPVQHLVPRPVPADRLFAVLDRARVPRSPLGIVLVDGDLRVLDSTSKTLGILGYHARPEPDGHAALRACAESPPAAVLMSPFLLGIDPFAFLVHLRQLPGLAAVPVILAVPRRFEEAESRLLVEAAETAAQDRRWTKFVSGPTTRPRPAPETTA